MKNEEPINSDLSQLVKVAVVLFIILLVCDIGIFAQVLPPDPGKDPNSAPIDGGLSVLIAAGVGYGVKKIREKRKK